MTGPPRIAAVGVIVPARDEQERIAACLHSVRQALGQLPQTVSTAVTVVLDRCRDRTPDIVARLLEDWPGAAAVRVAALGGARAGSALGPEPAHIVAGSGVGAVRDLGVRRALGTLRAHPPDAVWLLHTDADTTVPPSWVLDHLAHADAGVCGVAGMADLADVDGLSADARRLYREIVREDRLDRGRHHHVYGANLGVRADAYLDVGGFPVDGVGEDHGLWSRLGESGRPLVQPVGVRVRTSARLRGRAAGGLADLLLALHGPTPPGVGHPDTRDGA